MLFAVSVCCLLCQCVVFCVGAILPVFLCCLSLYLSVVRCNTVLFAVPVIFATSV